MTNFGEPSLTNILQMLLSCFLITASARVTPFLARALIASSVSSTAVPLMCSILCSYLSGVFEGRVLTQV